MGPICNVVVEATAVAEEAEGCWAVSSVVLAKQQMESKRVEERVRGEGRETDVDVVRGKVKGFKEAIDSFIGLKGEIFRLEFLFGLWFSL